jgi:hypothetical protein
MLYSTTIGVVTLFGNIVVSSVEDLGTHYKLHKALAIDVGQQRLQDGKVVNAGLIFGCINPLAKGTEEEVPHMTVEIPKHAVMYFFEPMKKIVDRYEDITSTIKIAPASVLAGLPPRN